MKNKLPIIMVIVFVSFALCSICSIVLIYNTMQENKKLEMQKRELRASLEASRIRIENFCEYPADSLCNVELPGNFSAVEQKQALPEPAGRIVPVTANVALEEKQEIVKEVDKQPVQTDNMVEKENDTAKIEQQANEQIATKKDETQSSESKEPAIQQAEAAKQESLTAVPEIKEQPSTKKDVRDEVQKKEKTNSGINQLSETFVPPKSSLKKAWKLSKALQNGLEYTLTGEGLELPYEADIKETPESFIVVLNDFYKFNTYLRKNIFISKVEIRYTKNTTELIFIKGRAKTCSLIQRSSRTINLTFK